MKSTSIHLALGTVFLALSTGTTCAQLFTAELSGLARTSYSSSRQVLIPKFDPSLGTLTAVTLSYSIQYSGTIGGVANGPRNAPDGWSMEFGGTIRLNGTGFGNLDFVFDTTRSGLTFQPSTPVFETFGPSNVSNSKTFTQNMSSYVGLGNVAASLAWPNFTEDLFFSNGGSQTSFSRALGSVGGQVTYQYIPVPEPEGVMALASAALLVGACARRLRL